MPNVSATTEASWKGQKFLKEQFWQQIIGRRLIPRHFIIKGKLNKHSHFICRPHQLSKVPSYGLLSSHGRAPPSLDATLLVAAMDWAGLPRDVQPCHRTCASISCRLSSGFLFSLMIPLTFLTYNQLGLFANREKEYVEIVLSSNKKGIMPFFWGKSLYHLLNFSKPVKLSRKAVLKNHSKLKKNYKMKNLIVLDSK